MIKGRPLPIPTPETRAYWQATSEKRLVLQQCAECKHIYFPPRPFCPSCASRAITEIDASGKATLYSYIINHLPAPGYDTPFVIAVVQLNEGPRMMCNIVGCLADPSQLELDMEVEVTFEEREDGHFIPQFKPATEQNHG